MQEGNKLLRLLGAGFGIAVIVGGTVSVGILRTPGQIAAQLGDARLVIAMWLLGGLYVLLGSLAVAELATMIPRAGGFYVYAQRAFGDGAGLMVGGSDFLGQCAAVAFGAVSVGEFAAALAPALRGSVTPLACAVILLFGLIQWTGLRPSSRIQQGAALIKGVAFAALVAACFRAAAAPGPRTLASLPAPWTLLAPVVVALQAVIATYDGWYCAIYFSEEDRNPSRNLPRSLIGGTALVIAVYLLVNAAFLRVLSMPQLAASRMPATDALRSLAGSGAGTITTALALFSVLPLIHALLLCSSRIVYGMSRDRLLPARAAYVNARGTPGALWVCVALSLLFAASGTFEALIAVAGFIYVVNHCSAFVSLLVLRRREPAAPRPFRAWLYPWSTLAALGGGVTFLIGALIGDTLHSVIALALVLAGYPLYRGARRLILPRVRAASVAQG